MNTLQAALLILTAITCQAVGQESPCPNSFQYFNDNGLIYGFIQLKPGYFGKVVTSVGFTIAAPLPSKYVGKLSLMDSRLSSGVYDGLHVSGVRYRVDFPITNPLPKLTFLKVNDELLCKGAEDPAKTPIKPGEYRTTISLQHTLFLNKGADDAGFPPPRPLPPIDNFYTPSTSPGPIDIYKILPSSTTKPPPVKNVKKPTKTTAAPVDEPQDSTEDDGDYEEEDVQKIIEKTEKVVVTANHTYHYNNTVTTIVKPKAKKPKNTDLDVNPGTDGQKAVHQNPLANSQLGQRLKRRQE